MSNFIEPKTRMYRIVCLQRSNYPSDKVYWCPKYSGYTDNIDDAGLYWAEELDGAAGKTGDWIVEPCWV